MFQYESNQKKSLICPLNRTELAKKVDFITIHEGCFVQTPNMVIRSSLDRTRTVKQMAKVIIDNYEELMIPLIENQANLTLREKTKGRMPQFGHENGKE